MINIDIYATTIDIVLLDSHEEAKLHVEELNKKYNKDFEIIRFEGCMFQLPNRYYQLVFLRQFINPNLIFHETYHCSEFIADSCSLETEGAKESRAYLIGYIGEKVWEFLKINLVESPEILKLY